MDNIFNRAHLLVAQNRPDEARKILIELLTSDPNNVYALAMLCEIQTNDENYDEALEYINKAISLSPDTPNLLYTKAITLYETEELDEAENLLHQAIKLDPEDADYFALLASIRLFRKKFKEALELANNSLELEPDNLLALNTRSSALLKLNRTEESFDAIKNALNEDPNNAYTHANFGWSLLERGDHKKALEHFKEALKNDPNYSYAQEGMAEAIKAKYLLYKWFLMYSFWISNLTERYQWAVLIGYVFATKALRGVAKNNESLQPIIYPILIVLTLIAFSTWIITPISNLFLRLNKYGKYLLDKEEKMSANSVAISASISILSLIGYLLVENNTWLLGLVIYGFAMMIPLSSMFIPTRKKNALLIYTISMGAIGLVAIIKTYMTNNLINGYGTLFLLGFVAYMWFANYMIIRKNNI